jgi:WhiB family redox-sensing transcriptional regulator
VSDSESTAQVWPSTLDGFWAWHEQAACRDVDSTVFYSPEGERGPRKTRRERAAKEICARCDVRELCATYALATREPYGTWGGMSEGERREQWRTTGVAEAELEYRDALARWEADTARRLESRRAG